MYSHTLDRNRVDVVDLDPYGTAAPFIDSAVQCVNDGGPYLPRSSLDVACFDSKFIFQVFCVLPAQICLS